MEIALVLLVGALVVGLLALYAKLIDAENKGSRVDLLDGRVAAMGEMVRKKNAYIKNIETALLDSASPARVVDILNGVFTDKNGLPSGAKLHRVGPTGEADPPLDTVVGEHSPTSD